MFKTGFWVQNHLLKLCSSAVNSESLLYSQKAYVLKLYVIQNLFLYHVQNNNYSKTRTKSCP